jgi:hypothetical protein
MWIEKRWLFDDCKDDWILDRFRFLDLLKTNHFDNEIEAAVNANISIGGILNPPKGKLLTRQTEVSDIFSRIAFMNCIRSLQEWYQQNVDKEIVCNNLLNSGLEQKTIFEHYYKGWKEFQVKSLVVIKDRNLKVANADISNFFPSIRKKNIYKLMKQAGVPAKKKKEISSCLKRIREIDTLGLPQNSDFSSFLANILMIPMDKMFQKKCQYYSRYVDDIRFACDDERDLGMLMVDFGNYLRQINMYINSSKTEVYDLNTLDDHRAFKIFGTSKEIEKIQEQVIINRLSNDRFAIGLMDQYCREYLLKEEVDKKVIKYILGRYSYLNMKYQGLEKDRYDIIVNLIEFCFLKEPGLAIDITKLLISLKTNYAKELEMVAKKTIFTYVTYLVSYVCMIKGIPLDSIKSLYEHIITKILQGRTYNLEQELIWACWLIIQNNSQVDKSNFPKNIKLKFFYSRRIIFSYSNILDESFIQSFMDKKHWEIEKFQIESVKYFFQEKENSVPGVERFSYCQSADLESYL